jgi:GT2 family glycosyltransferase
MVFLPKGKAELKDDAVLEISTGDAQLSLTPRDVRMIVLDPPTLVRETFAPLDADTRNRLLQFLALALNGVPRGERYELSSALQWFRQALRERLPETKVSDAKRRGLHVDRIMAVDERSVYIEGWMHHEDLEIVRLTAVSPEGSRAEMFERLARYPRPDVAQHFQLGTNRIREKVGFVCFIELDAPSLQPDGWILEVEDERGVAEELLGPTVVTDTFEVRSTILHDPTVEKLLNGDLMADHVFPAITRIQDRLDTEVTVESVVQHGTPPEDPDVSIVIPLYQQIAHLEIQLAQFADDPELAAADIIYVLDSPEDAYTLRKYAAELYPIYEIPFRVVTLDANVGFAGATNAGAARARGRLLLLLNSDVLPGEPGWLGKMRDFYAATPDIGALGPKMLYEDDSIQHAGMYFVPYPDPGLSVWVDSTYFKGMHRNVPAANIARPVPAVSGACMMIDRGLYEAAGGLQRIYVRGDYEDSHLCMHLLEQGRHNWYLPDAELYHLEAQSYSSEARGDSNRFNMWLYTRIWRDRIESLMREVDSAHAGAAAGNHQ